MNYKEGYFSGYDNLKLYYRSWLPAREPLAVLLIVHGLAEHSARYRVLANHFTDKGFAVYSFDQRGHGKSEGFPGYVNRFREYLHDLMVFSSFVREKHKGSRCFLLGHSVGGLIAASFIPEHQNCFSGLILSGATVKPGSSLSPVKIAAARLLSLVLPKLGVDKIDATAVSCNQEVVNAYINDPLVYHGKISARLGSELLGAMRQLGEQMPRIELPTLIMHGTSDRLSDPEGSRLLYERTGSSDKALKEYDGFYHEIFNEPGHLRVFKDMEDWLKARL